MTNSKYKREKDTFSPFDYCKNQNFFFLIPRSATLRLRLDSFFSFSFFLFFFLFSFLCSCSSIDVQCLIALLSALFNFEKLKLLNTICLQK